MAVHLPWTPPAEPKFSSGRSSPLADARQLAARRFLHLNGAGFHAELEYLLGRRGRKHVHHTGDDAGPSGLVAGAEAGAVVAVEVLVE